MNYLIKGAGRCGSHWLCETLQAYTKYDIGEINLGKVKYNDTDEFRNYVNSCNGIILHNHHTFIPKDPSKWHYVFLTRRNILKRVSSVYFTRITNDNNINSERTTDLIKKYQNKKFGISYKKFDDIYQGIVYVEMLLQEEIKKYDWHSVTHLYYEDFINDEIYIKNIFNLQGECKIQRKYHPSIFNIEMLENYQQLKDYVDKKYKDAIINYD